MRLRVRVCEWKSYGWTIHVEHGCSQSYFHRCLRTMTPERVEPMIHRSGERAEERDRERERPSELANERRKNKNRKERDEESERKKKIEGDFCSFCSTHKNGLKSKNAFPLLNNKYKMPSHPLNSIQTGTQNSTNRNNGSGNGNIAAPYQANTVSKESHNSSDATIFYSDFIEQLLCVAVCVCLQHASQNGYMWWWPNVSTRFQISLKVFETQSPPKFILPLHCINTIKSTNFSAFSPIAVVALTPRIFTMASGMLHDNGC